MKDFLKILALCAVLSALFLLAMELIFGADAMHLIEVKEIDKPLGAILPATLTIDYCGKSRTYTLTELKTKLFGVERVDPCLAKTYVKVLNLLNKQEKIQLNTISGNDLRSKLETYYLQKK